MWLLHLSEEEPKQSKLLREKQIIIPVVKQHLYTTIFLTEFNICFGLPRTDTCATCDRLEMSAREAESRGDAPAKSSITEKLRKDMIP